MEEIEVPLEQVTENLHHHAHASSERWVTWVALSAALLAALAAVSAMMSGHHANYAVIAQIQSANGWARYQAKSIKLNLTATKEELAGVLSKDGAAASAVADAKSKQESYKAEMEEIATESRQKELSAEHHLECHEVLARAVTMFQVAIAVGAISALSKRRTFWLASLIFGVIGLGFLIQGVMMAGH